MIKIPLASADVNKLECTVPAGHGQTLNSSMLICDKAKVTLISKFIC